MKIRTINEVFLDPTTESEKVQEMRKMEGYACISSSRRIRETRTYYRHWRERKTYRNGYWTV